MERRTSLISAKEIMGKNFIGPDELKASEKQMGIFIPDVVLFRPPAIQFVEDTLEKLKNDYILILGVPYYKDKSKLTIVKMRNHFGWDSQKSEPCFYNQDWYLNENFATETSFNLQWYLIKKNIFEEFRGKALVDINTINKLHLPTAVLSTYVFFAYFYHQKEILWKYDFIWCADTDTNIDSIYAGRYIDIKGINKNGFNIHRFLTLKNNYSLIEFYE